MSLMNHHTKQLFVSVIIPVYNNQAGIDACLAALADQNYQRGLYEVVVVDNVSDPVIRIAPEYSTFARYVVCQMPGSYAARNAGIKEARGDVLAFTDADCIPDREWIRAGVNALDREKNRCVVGGEVGLSLPKHAVTAVERYQLIAGFMQRENIEYRGFTATANLFAAKAQIKEIGLFNERLLSGGDREWSWRAAKAGFPVKYAPDVFVWTTPRTSLVSAIRQARRVAGGRYTLRNMRASHITTTGIKPHRSGVDAVKWILSHPQLTLMSRIRVFTVAVIIKIASILETTRLRLGQKPERR